VEAVDFLLKPFDDERFARAVGRAKDKIHTRRRNPLNNQILAVKNAGRVILLNTVEIDWIEAADYYSSLHVGAKTYLVRRSMNELDRDLDKSLFCRIHRSTIVNLRQVQELSFGSDGAYEIVLKNGTKLRLSRRYRELLQAHLREISSC
jgi:two-component system LytT family response regulator